MNLENVLAIFLFYIEFKVLLRIVEFNYTKISLRNFTMPGLFIHAARKVESRHFSI